MYDKRIFQHNLENVLDQKGYTQRSIAELLNTTETTISRYVLGRRTPNLEMLVAIADVLRMSIDELVGYEPSAKPRPAPDVTILTSCYQRADDRDRRILWEVLDRYMSPEQRALVKSIQEQEKDAAV